jgi:regulator of protease activity HflC (stomatin/prohibitin superfamily)
MDPITLGVIAVIGVIGGLTALTALAKSFVSVNQNEEVIIEKFGGGYFKTLKKTGYSLKRPWQAAVARISLALKEVSEAHECRTSDDIFPSVPVKAHLQIVDSNKFNYQATDPMKQVMSRIGAAVKQEVMKVSFTDLYKERQTISTAISNNVGPEIERLYGVRLVDVIVDQPVAPDAIRASFVNAKPSEQNRIATTNNAEAQRQAKILNAQADKEAAILDGEGKRQWVILDGEGQAGSREAIFKNYEHQIKQLTDTGMTIGQVHEFVLQMSKNDTMRDISKQGNTIFFFENGGTSESQNGGMKQLLAAFKAANINTPGAEDGGAAKPAKKSSGPAGPS